MLPPTEYNFELPLQLHLPINFVLMDVCTGASCILLHCSACLGRQHKSLIVSKWGQKGTCALREL